MRIAQIAPLIESVPPRRYGGTERVVHYLTEELVRLGHDVTLFASGDSATSARLLASVPRALRLDSQVIDPLPYSILQLEHIRARAHLFDILHFHIDPLQYPLIRMLDQPCVTTLHGRLDSCDMIRFYSAFEDIPLVSISDYQRRPLPNAHWVTTVHHGLGGIYDSIEASGGAGTYLAFLGRISPEKRPDRAVQIAQRAGYPLRIAAKVDRADERYHESEIAPMIDDESVQFLGELAEDEKPPFLGDARALLFPIDWPEPFGLVMIEAMACGTPVIGWRNGSVPEIIEPGITGFIVESIEEAAEAVEWCAELDRSLIRLRYEERFSAQRMTRDYLAVYRRLIGANRPRSARSVAQT